MNVPTIVMSRSAALEKLAAYQTQLERRVDAEYEAAVAAFQLESVVGYRETIADGVDLEGVTSTEDGELVIELESPFPEFLSVLADPALAPVPASVDDEAFADSPVGNGPFKMGEPWQHGRFVRVVRFDDHAHPAFLDEIVFTIYDDDPTLSRQWDDLAAGQLAGAAFRTSRQLQLRVAARVGGAASA